MEAREEWQREYPGSQESVMINRSNPWSRNGELDGQRNPHNEGLYVGEGVHGKGRRPEWNQAVVHWSKQCFSQKEVRRLVIIQLFFNYACLNVSYMFAVLIN